MTTEPDLAPDLERALGHLPDVPATTYLVSARGVRRRRRAVAGVAAVAVLVGGVAAGTTWLDEPERTPVASGGPAEGGSLEPQPVSGPGLKGVEAFTTEGIPDWAQEHGNHGPVALAPNGRMWVAPEATVLRTVVDPLTPTEETPVSYAVEAEFKGRTVWVWIPGGVMDDPGRWTTDFDLWVEDQVDGFEGRPTVAERMVHFAGPDTETLAAGPQAELVRQLDDIELPGTYEQYERASVAEVRWRGQSWFVLAVGPHNGTEWTDAYEQSITGATDLEGFVAWLGERG